MITFRFYVVSTVAFFLALAVGVVVGSVLDGRIADSLQDRLDGVERSLDETVASIDAKNALIDQTQEYVAESAPYAVQSRLDATATLVIAEAGVSADPVEDLVLRLRQGGSNVEGIIWLDRRMDLSDESDRQMVADLMGMPVTARPAALRAELWSKVFGVATGAEPADTIDSGAGGSDGTTSSSTTTAPETTTTLARGATTTTLLAPAEVQPGMFDQALLAELSSAGLVRLQVIDGNTSESVPTQVLSVAVTGSRSAVSHPGALSGEAATGAALSQVPTVLAEVMSPSEGEDLPRNADRGTLVTNKDLADTPIVSTVDDLDLVSGRVASVLALADLRTGISGRYGLGPDVDALVPPWQGP